MKAGTIIRLPDDRLATVVYHFLDGYGAVIGEQPVDPDDLPEPEIMLRDPYPSASVPCVGGGYEFVRSPQN